MKKKQCVIAISCLIAGLIGFGGVYATERAAEKRQEEQLAQQQEVTQQTEQSEMVSSVIPPKTTNQQKDVQVQEQKEPQVEIIPKQEVVSPDLETTDEYVEEPVEETVEEIAPKETFRDTLHFASEENLVWPLEGNVLLDYSMDATIYFPTLDQYRCNPAIVIGGEVNSKVYLVAPGVITDISTNEVTGCTVTQDLGDGYSAVYGQLKELNFSVGDEVEGGQVIGYVSEPTKYYSVEGSNLYFELLKDGEPVNPLEYFE